MVWEILCGVFSTLKRGFFPRMSPAWAKHPQDGVVGPLIRRLDHISQAKHRLFFPEQEIAFRITPYAPQTRNPIKCGRTLTFSESGKE